MLVRTLGLPPDATAIVRRLARRPGLAALVSRPVGAQRPEDSRWSFVACDPDGESEALIPAGGTSEGPGWNGSPPGPGWIGVVPYEALRAIERPAWTRYPDARPPAAIARPAWRHYPAVVRVDHILGVVCVEAENEDAASRLVRALGTEGEAGGFDLEIQPPDEPPEAHLERVRAALGLIAAGDLYQVNLARRIGLTIRGDPVALFTSLLDAAPAPWGFYQDLGRSIVCASSPELALSVRGDVIRTSPIKGTRPRGGDAEDDARFARELEADAKERAELVMAIDVHRNDLGVVAVPGSVRLTAEPRIVAGRTVWSRAADVVARRLPGVGLEAIARACLPSGSVTGAPKVRAMEVIAKLEPCRRGVYTGVFGYVGRSGTLSLAMAIRTLEIGDGNVQRPAAYFTGGGIVADSVPEHEVDETRWKASHLEGLGAMRKARK